MQAKWTEEILDEVANALRKNLPDITDEKIVRLRDLMNAAVRDCLVAGYEPLIPALELPDPDDRHVLAAAIKAKAQPESPAGATPRPKPRPRYLRVVVLDNSGGDGPGRVNIRVPLQLLRAGVRLTSLIPPQALTRINAELDKSGVPIDLTQLKPQDIEELIEQLDDVTVDVNEPDAKVQVFCE